MIQWWTGHIMALDKSEILNLIRAAPEPISKRDIAQALGIKGGENRVALKQILKLLEKNGAIEKAAGDNYSVPGSLPEVAVIEVTSISVDGDVRGTPIEWDEALRGKRPVIEIMPDKKHYPVMKERSRALCRLRRINDNTYEAFIIKPLDTARGLVMGLVRVKKSGAVLIPVDKKAKNDFDLNTAELDDVKDGDLAIGEIQPSRDLKRKRARIIKVIGRQEDPKAISLISLYENGLHEDWPPQALKDAEGLKVPNPQDREDLRALPLVTIDGIDARDFDDAVFAEKTENGFHLIVAIADVAYYVRAGSALDKEAQRRGNSTYFPDRVVPMLPEALSNDLCSLRPHEPRACMVAHLWIDMQGQLQKYKFTRGLMQSAARLVYEQVQAAYDGQVDDVTGPLLEPVIKPLYEAYGILDLARQKRRALDLDLPERQIIINEDGDMTGVKKRMRLDSHKLIEEFMILANVAAASALESKAAKTGPRNALPCVYRIHDRPSFDKLESVREFIENLGLSLPKGQVTQPAQINGVLRQGAETPYSHLISQVILRAQAQAVYSVNNIGHFGLALSHYAHFTSPIRRYADLLVHRALIRAYGLGPGGLDDLEISRIEETCQHISQTERVSMEAERSAVDRFTASWLSERCGAEFSGKITGVTRFGLFVTLDESGADGLIPMRSMGDDFYEHDERAHALIGKRKNKIFRLGALVTVRLMEANGLTGSTLLELSGASRDGADIPGFQARFRPTGRHKSGPPRGKSGGEYKKKPNKYKKGEAAEKPTEYAGGGKRKPFGSTSRFSGDSALDSFGGKPGGPSDKGNAPRGGKRPGGDKGNKHKRKP
ncbi:MAG: ribonuclease R [Alphaproteobacteria bacterium]|nr:ribonuclease R [Alphaproteobacteria bacterium]